MLLYLLMCIYYIVILAFHLVSTFLQVAGTFPKHVRTLDDFTSNSFEGEIILRVAGVFSNYLYTRWRLSFDGETFLKQQGVFT